MPCYVEAPEMSFKDHIELMLCKACKHLSREQIVKISPNTGYIGLLEWYCYHLLEDYNNNYNNHDFSMQLNSDQDKDKELIIKEFDRLKVKLTLKDGKIKGLEY